MSETWCFNQFDKEYQHVIMTWFILNVLLDIFIDNFKICNHKALNSSNTTFWAMSKISIWNSFELSSFKAQ